MNDMLKNTKTSGWDYRITCRISEKEKNIIDKKVINTGLTVAAYCRKAALCKEIKQRLSPEERKLADNIDILTENVKKFNNALKGWTKNMSPDEKAKFILNGKMLGAWSEVVEEIYKCEREMLDRLD